MTESGLLICMPMRSFGTATCDAEVGSLVSVQVLLRVLDVDTDQER
jgi:hypothetical protein